MAEPLEAPPTEATPLVGEAVVNNAKPKISLARALAIMIPMSILILIQSTIKDFLIPMIGFAH